MNEYEQLFCLRVETEMRHKPLMNSLCIFKTQG